jgi:DNA-binding XRE family transcriptional regulator
LEKLMIGETIYTLRKEKKITQEQLANFIGVSAAAVSKWESGCSYPDITLLPILATFFNVSVDKLLNFKIELSDEEVMKLFCECEKLFSSGKLEIGMEKSKEYVAKYPSCYYLKFRMAFLFCMYSWKSLNEENQRSMVNDSVQLLEDIEKNCNNKELVDQALFQLGALYPLVEEEDKAIIALEKLKKSQLDPNMLLASIYIGRNEFKRARTLLQTNLYKSISDIGMSCMGLANSHMKENKDLEMVEKYYRLSLNMKRAVSEVEATEDTDEHAQVDISTEAEAFISSHATVDGNASSETDGDAVVSNASSETDIDAVDVKAGNETDGDAIDGNGSNKTDADSDTNVNRNANRDVSISGLSLAMEYLSLAQIYLEVKESQKAMGMLLKMLEDLKQNDINKPESFNSIWCFNEIPAAKRTITMNLYENILKILEQPIFDAIRGSKEFENILGNIDSYKNMKHVIN